ncbi:MAG: CopG family transcriptional regulator [Thermoprotei archaeon]|nr:MAG: CopG family transcriptional regulator [Thermoprotei archaeon]
MTAVSEVVSFKVRREVKEKMQRYKDIVNWSEELRKFVEAKLRELEAKENFVKVMEKLHSASWSVPKGFSVSVVREDRDSS